MITIDASTGPISALRASTPLIEAEPRRAAPPQVRARDRERRGGLHARHRERAVGSLRAARTNPARERAPHRPREPPVRSVPQRTWDRAARLRACAPPQRLRSEPARAEREAASPVVGPTVDTRSLSGGKRTRARSRMTRTRRLRYFGPGPGPGTVTVLHPRMILTLPSGSAFSVSHELPCRITFFGAFGSS